MLCSGKSGRCNSPVEAKHLSDRDHYECEKCGEKWDTDTVAVMESSGSLPKRMDRRPCTCPPKEPWKKPRGRMSGTSRNRHRPM